MTNTGGFFKPSSDDDKEAFAKRVMEALEIAQSVRTGEARDGAEAQPGDDN